MENVPQVVFPISPTGIMGGDEANIDAPSPFTFRPKYLIVPRLVAPDFRITQFRVSKKPVFEWAIGEVEASVFNGDCTPYLIREIPAKIPLDFPVPLKLPVCTKDDTIGLRVRNTSCSSRLFSAVILGELVE